MERNQKIGLMILMFFVIIVSGVGVYFVFFRNHGQNNKNKKNDPSLKDTLPTSGDVGSKCDINEDCDEGLYCGACQKKCDANGENCVDHCMCIPDPFYKPSVDMNEDNYKKFTENIQESNNYFSEYYFDTCASEQSCGGVFNHDVDGDGNKDGKYKKTKLLGYTFSNGRLNGVTGLYTVSAESSNYQNGDIEPIYTQDDICNITREGRDRYNLCDVEDIDEQNPNRYSSLSTPDTYILKSKPTGDYANEFMPLYLCKLRKESTNEYTLFDYKLDTNPCSKSYMDANEKIKVLGYILKPGYKKISPSPTPTLDVQPTPTPTPTPNVQPEPNRNDPYDNLPVSDPSTRESEETRGDWRGYIGYDPQDFDPCPSSKYGCCNGMFGRKIVKSDPMGSNCPGFQGLNPGFESVFYN